MSSPAGLQGTLARLRDDFDDAFARPHAGASSALIDLLEIRVGGAPYALRLQQVDGLHADRRLVRVPSPRVDLLGIANLRGVVAPVYDLAQLIGHAPGNSPRWLALVSGSAAFSVAFERFERHVRVPPTAITKAADDDTRGFISGSVRSASGFLPLIDLLALLQAVMSRAGHAPAPKREETP